MGADLDNAVDACELLGSVRLALPGEVLDLLASPDAASARQHFETTVADLFPGLGPHHRELMVTGLLGWREKALSQGELMHGFVSLPPGSSQGDVTFDSAVSWQVLAGVVEVPRTGDVDPGEIVSRYLGQQLDPDSAYVESFPTRMGWGAGLLTTLPLGLPAEVQQSLVDRGFPLRLGVALAVAAPVDSPYGLLVIGLCLDGETTVDLGSLVAYIAGQSVIDASPVREESAWQPSTSS
jgi:hypothetical protein